MDTVCLAGRSALEFWFRESLPLGLSLKPMEPVANRLDSMGLLLAAPMLRLPNAAPADKQIERLATGPLFGFRLPVDLLVASGDMRRPSKQKTCHVWSRPVPSGALVRVSDTLYVSTPEFAFYQLAASGTPGSIVRLCHELCASYVRSSVDSRGFRTCSPLSSPELIDGFLSRLDGSPRVIANYRSLVRRARAGAASPMETLLSTRLALSRTAGGYGMVCDELNGRVDLPPVDGARGPRPRFYFGDLVWHKQKLIVEYDSEQFHTGSQRIDEDARRRNDLQDCGYSVVTVTKQQMYNEEAFHCVAMQIANKLGRRFHQEARQYDWAARRAALADELLRREEPWSSLF